MLQAQKHLQLTSGDKPEGTNRGQTQIFADF